jgi:hypothetical protein
MRTLTDRQMDTGRRQLEIERDLIAQGMDPRDAAVVAARNVMPASGNGAELDNLEAAAAPLSVEPVLGGPSGAGRVAPPQSERVYRDDPTMGMAGMLAAREEAQAVRDAARAAMYDQRTQEYVDEYGMIGTPGAAPLTQDQRDARRNRTLREAEARHTPYQEDARIARMAERAGVSVPVAAEMVQGGYDDYAKQMNAQPWTVAGVNNTTAPPDFPQMAYAHRELRQMGDERRRQEQAAREQAVIRRRMAQTNPLEYMNRDDISDWNRMVTADQLLRRGYRGATPLDVDQAREQALALQESRRGLGQGFQQPTPAQQRAQNAQADAAEAQAADVTYTSARGIVGQYADDRSWTNFLSRVTSGGTDFHDPTVFTAAERQKAIAQLMARYPHLTEAEAAGIIDAAAANTTYVE